MEFNSKAYELKYEWKVSKDLTITPKLNYRYSQPWFYPADEATLNKSVVRETAGISGMWDISKPLNLTFGLEAFKDTNTASGAGQTFVVNGLNEFSYNNKAAYAQLLWMSDIVNVTVGGRFEKHSIAGDSFVPRIGITKDLGAFHFKLLAAKAFRAPVGENINRGTAGIKAEKTTTIEMETGYQFSPNLFATVNIFNISITDPIVWSGG
ncbi:TonB-dependent receptor, partial [bacterium]|nr:TonB-dependent receptor [bacterium]